ncbi:hypothetical protein QJQ45_025431 [Haematococcus lacustris]|nr:hypothetical protein QJQ45_025431 [Haematococcus lacustris]
MRPSTLLGLCYQLRKPPHMTTRGHGVFAQYSPEHYKEWICKENRRLERGASPERHVFDPANSLHRSSLYEPMGLRDEARIPAAPETAHANYYKMGSAQKYNQQVFFKASLISTRKV